MKTKEEIIEQRKQFPRVLVSEDNVNWLERILLFENIEGSCDVVFVNCEEDFLNGKEFSYQGFPLYKPLPEKKYVPFEHGREIDWDWVFKSKANNALFNIHSITETGLYLKNMVYYIFNELALYFELSKDGGQTWGYAGKEVEE